MAGIADVVGKVVEQTGISKKDADAAVRAFVDAVVDFTGEGEAVAIRGFGSFKAKTRAARTGRNPQSGEAIQIAAKTVLTFKAAK